MNGIIFGHFADLPITSLQVACMCCAVCQTNNIDDENDLYINIPYTDTLARSIRIAQCIVV